MPLGLYLPRVAQRFACEGRFKWGEVMVKSIAGLARLIATVLAIVAGFVAIPTFDVALALVILGIVAGFGYVADQAGRLFLVVLVLPAVGAALGTIPAIVAQLNAVALNVALAAAGVAASVVHAAVQQFQGRRRGARLDGRLVRSGQGLMLFPPRANGPRGIGSSHQ